MPGWARDMQKGLLRRRPSAGSRSSPPACRSEALEERAAVYGSTDDEPERHFLGWLGEVDPDELFASGAAYGLTVVRQAAGSKSSIRSADVEPRDLEIEIALDAAHHLVADVAVAPQVDDRLPFGFSSSSRSRW